MNQKVHPTHDNGNPSTDDDGVSESSTPVPAASGEATLVEVYCYPHLNEGAFVGIQNAAHMAQGVEMVENTTLRGHQAVELGRLLVAAGQRALELEQTFGAGQ